MGCPVPKICKTGAGAALLREPDRAVEVARAAIEGSGLPVTVKLRSGLEPGDRSGFDLARAPRRRGGGRRRSASTPARRPCTTRASPTTSWPASWLERDRRPDDHLRRAALRRRRAARLRGVRRRRGDDRPGRRSARRGSSRSSPAVATARRAATRSWPSSAGCSTAPRSTGASARVAEPAQVLPLVPRPARHHGP